MSQTAEDSVQSRAVALFDAGYRRAAIDVLQTHLADNPEDGSA